MEHARCAERPTGSPTARLFSPLQWRRAAWVAAARPFRLVSMPTVGPIPIRGVAPQAPPGAPRRAAAAAAQQRGPEPRQALGAATVRRAARSPPRGPTAARVLPLPL